MEWGFSFLLCPRVKMPKSEAVFKAQTLSLLLSFIRKIIFQ